MQVKADVLDALILIVDDRGPNVLLLEQLLQGLGYRQVQSTQDGFSVMEGLSHIEVDGYVPVLACPTGAC